LLLVHAAGLARVQLMAREQSVVHEQPAMLEGLTMHEPRSVCVSAQLKVVVILYEAGC
jgi:hypothetical protein